MLQARDPNCSAKTPEERRFESEEGKLRTLRLCNDAGLSPPTTTHCSAGGERAAAKEEMEKRTQAGTVGGEHARECVARGA